jgi:hypothetical protein|nr:MAG TPA: DNA-directed RNA polymerase [Caudoviricetes sp.]
MARYIDADNLIDELSAACMPIYEKGITGILGDNSSIADIINEQPTADVQEVKRGYWISERDPDENNRIQCFHCSVCDDDFHYIGAFVATKYCPNCGARMDGDNNDG